jgi:hypothetical protein
MQGCGSSVDLSFHFNADPNLELLKLLNFDFNADPDQSFHYDEDPDPASQNKADPCGSGSVILA